MSNRFLDFVGNGIIISFNTAYQTTANITPVYANSTANREVPLTFVGSAPGANYVWPWYQNTSTTANGYIANSTASFAPDNAGFISGNVLANTIATDYYKIVDTDFDLVPGVILDDQVCINLYGNVANITFQVVPFFKYTANNTAILDTRLMSTFTTSSAAPYTNTFTIKQQKVTGTTWNTTGYYLRNITASSELTLFALAHKVILNS